jgi:hypothetical protein
VAFLCLSYWVFWIENNSVSVAPLIRKPPVIASSTNFWDSFGRVEVYVLTVPQTLNRWRLVFFWAFFFFSH